MDLFITFLQVIVGLSIINVWLFRYNKKSSWRGGDARNMKEEFKIYGLPEWFVGVVGSLKVLFAVLLIVGIWYPIVVMPAAIGISVLMLGAIAMHFKVNDPIVKSLPSFTLLVLSLVIAFV